VVYHPADHIIDSRATYFSVCQKPCLHRPLASHPSIIDLCMTMRHSIGPTQRWSFYMISALYLWLMCSLLRIGARGPDALGEGESTMGPMGESQTWVSRSLELDSSQS
jgi:hypothetical protein